MPSPAAGTFAGSVLPQETGQRKPDTVYTAHRRRDIPEYAQKTGKGTTGTDGARLWMRSTAQRRSSASVESHAAPARLQTLQAALNEAPAVQAVAQLRRALNRNACVADVLQAKSGPGGVIQRVPMVAGEFLDPTPTEGKVLKASGSPLTSEEFVVKARFDKIAGNDRSDYRYGEYRQAVKGVFRKAGEAQKHLLHSGPMSETDWKEDRIKKERYGYRSASKGVFSDEGGTLNRAGGRFYQSSDRPSASEDDDEMDLHFSGRLVDTGDGHRQIAERTWSIFGRTGE